MIARQLLFASLISTSCCCPRSSGSALKRRQKHRSERRSPVTDAGQWRTLQKASRLRTVALERSEPSHTLELKLLRFDGRKSIIPRVLTAGQWQLKSASAKTFAEKSGAIAAINASYFDEKGRPLAYLKTATQEINRAISKHAPVYRRLRHRRGQGRS